MLTPFRKRGEAMAATEQNDVALETERLLLRRFRPEDLDALARIYADAEVRRHFPRGVLSREETQQEIERWRTGDPGDPRLTLWAATDKASGRLIGRAGFLRWELDGRTEVEVAYLLDKPWWRRGLGAEVVRGLVEHGVTQLGLTRLIALIAPENIASIKTAEAAGFKAERETKIHGLRVILHAREAG